MIVNWYIYYKFINITIYYSEAIKKVRNIYEVLIASDELVAINYTLDSVLLVMTSFKGGEMIDSNRWSWKIWNEPKIDCAPTYSIMKYLWLKLNRRKTFTNGSRTEMHVNELFRLYKSEFIIILRTSNACPPLIKNKILLARAIIKVCYAMRWITWKFVS